MSKCRCDHDNSYGERAVCPASWNSVKIEWNKALDVLPSDREMERFQGICRYVLLNRIDQNTGVLMAKKLKAGVESVFSSFLEALCDCYHVDLSKYAAEDQSKMRVRFAATNAVLALKALQYSLGPPDHSAVATVPKYTERLGNILLKDILENALNLHCPSPTANEAPIHITARDILDSFILTPNPNAIFLKDAATINLKKKLVNIIESNQPNNATSPILTKQLQLIKQENSLESDKSVYSYLSSIFPSKIDDSKCDDCQSTSC